MRRILYIIGIAVIALAALSCERRALTYDYDPTLFVDIELDWSDMSTAPTGVSVYCYPEDGGDPIVTISNTISNVTVELGSGLYNILVFNQIPSDYGTIIFEGMNNFSTASINAVSSSTLQGLTGKSDSDEIARDPEEVAAATYLQYEVTEEAISESVELKSKGGTKSSPVIYETISLAPQVVIKNTQVKIRVLGIYNYSSATAKLYGMATGYNFSQAKSHSDMTTHLLEDWSSTAYDYDITQGEVSIVFSCFGLPGQSASSQVSDYATWEGVLDVDITLVDLKTVISESIPLHDKITSTDQTKADDDTEANLDVGIDINISSGYGLTDDDDPITLPDVEPAGSGSSGFDATVDDWGDEEVTDIPI